MRKIVRYAWMIAASLAALCVLLAVLIVAVALGFQRERLRSVVESALERAVEAEVSIGALEGRLLPGLAVRDLRVGPTDAPWFEVKRASWRIRGFDLSERRIDVGRLRLAGVRVRLDRRGVERAAAAPSAAAAALRLSIKGVQFRDSALEWIWSDACAGPCRIRARGAGAVSRLEWPMSREALGALRAEIAVDFEGALPGRVKSEPLPLEGRMQARFEREALRIATFELRTSDRSAALEEEAQLLLAEDGLAIEKLRFRSEGATLGLRGELKADRFDGLELAARGVEVEQLAQLAGIPLPLAGRVDADLRLDGDFSRPGVRGDLRWEDARVREMHFDRILVTLRAAEPSVEFSLRVVQGQRELAMADVALPYEAALTGELASMSEAAARIRSEAFEIALLAPLLPGDPRGLSGMARADLSWRGGAVPSLTGWVELDAGCVELPRFGGPLAPLRARAAFAPETDGVRVESFDLETPLGHLEGSGVYAQSALRDTQLHFTAVDVAALARRLGAAHELGGEARAELALDGPLEWPSMRGFATWSRPRIGAAEAERIALEIELDATRLRGSARMQQAGLQALMLRADLPRSRGSEPAAWLGTGAEIEMVGDRFELAPWMSLLPASAVPSELRSLGGLAQADLLWRGGAAPTLEGSFGIDAGRIELPRVGDALTPFRARAALSAIAGGVAFESFAMETPIGRARGRGIRVGDTLRDVQLDLDGIDVAGLATRLGVFRTMGGEAAAELSIEGPIDRPSVRGAARWLRPRIATAQAERVVVDIDADAARVRGTARVQDAGRDALLLAAVLPRPDDGSPSAWLGPGAEIDLSGENFDLAALAPLLPRQLSELRGRADLQLRLDGSAAAPRLAGELRVSGGAVSAPLLGQTFAPIEGSVQLASSRLLPEIRIGPPEARAVLTGSIELRDLAPASGDLDLVLSHFALARSKLLKLDVTGALRLKGPVRALALLGELRLESAQIRVPEEQDPILREIMIATRPGTDAPLVESAPPEPSALERATMELALLLPRNTWVRGRGIELELEGDLDLAKASLGPVRYAGTVSAVRGRYAFLGKRFDVRRGTASFEGSERLDPLIDVEAVHRVRDVDILAYLTGHLSNPVLRLSSEPEYEESDVLALLLVGRRADELTQPSGDLDAAATKLAAGILANELSSVLQDYTPVDSVDVHIGEDGVPEEVGVGKYVLQDLFVRYGRTFGIEQKDKIGIEYRIDENWSIESEMVTDRSAGADLVWSVDF